MSGMKVNIFSLQRIRSKGACSFAFHGVPQPERVIQIFNRAGEQIATMKETVRARPTLIFERLKYADEDEGGGEVEAEVLGGKGIQIELLHRRLGHTSQSVIDRLVREQMVRGLEEGVK